MNNELKNAQQHIIELERRYKRTLLALERAVSISIAVETSNTVSELRGIFSEIEHWLSGVLGENQSAIYLVDQANEFHLAHCSSFKAEPLFDENVQSEIENGMFGWALQQSRPVVTYLAHLDKTLIMHALATRKKVWGMFLCMAPRKPEELDDGVNALLTVIMNFAAHAIESQYMYQLEKNQKESLEKLVRERTADLESAMRQAQSANKAKSAFLANMSHELRTPLNAMLGYAQLLEMEQLDEGKKEAVDTILKSGWHLLDLINDVLDLAKVEADKIQLSLVPGDLSALLHECLSMSANNALQLGVTLNPLEMNVTCDAVMCDPVRVKQVLLNLLSNAIKYNKPGGNVTLSCEQIGDEHYRFTVRDTGHGIAPELQTQVFENFNRLGAESTDVEGTGIGLSLTKQLVERMGGSITFTSELNVGSTFTVELGLAHYSELQNAA